MCVCFGRERIKSHYLHYYRNINTLSVSDAIGI